MFMVAFCLAISSFVFAAGSQYVMASGPYQGWRKTAASSLISVGVLVFIVALVLMTIAAVNSWNAG